MQRRADFSVLVAMVTYLFPDLAADLLTLVAHTLALVRVGDGAAGGCWQRSDRPLSIPVTENFVGVSTAKVMPSGALDQYGWL